MTPSQHPTADLCARFDAAELDPQQLTSEEARIVAGWQSLRDDLQAIPVAPANLAGAVMRAIGTEMADVAEMETAVAEERPAAGPRVVSLAAEETRLRPAQHAQRARIATLVSVLTLVSCVVLLSVLPQIPVSSFQSLTAINMDSLAEELANCDVVVVRVPQNTADSDLDGLGDLNVGSTLARDAMPLRELDQAGEQMFADLAEFDRETNPEFIGDMTREELLAKVLESVETPSLAEEHFGEMLVLFPSDLLDEIRAEAGGGTLIAGDVPPAAAPAEPTRVASASPRTTPRRKVFVVLKMPAETDTEVVPDVSRLPGFGPLDTPWRYTGV